jgi:oligopeptide/dipeptide ABC transporter ATP-binding protein
MNLLRIENLRIYFNQQAKIIKAVDGVDLTVPVGNIIGIAGESGCGKTTLARTILGFYKPRTGKIFFKDKEITNAKNEKIIRKNIQIVFQNPLLSLDPRYTVFATLYEALTVFQKVNPKDAKYNITKALEEVELLPNLMCRYPHELSGGQLQRVCLARAMINRPNLIILDEPTSSLDVTTAAKIINLIKRLQKIHNISFLFISHNLKLLKKISQVIYIMYQGQIVEYGPKNMLFNEPLHPYTKLLLAAAEYKLDQNLVEPSATQSGCVFLNRCRDKTDQCLTAPKLTEIHPGHFASCQLPYFNS